MEDTTPMEDLLYEEEGTILDFKRTQYPFIGESDHVKSEIIKDILAFANAWRRADAYILLGVEEVKGGRSKPVGIDVELDDAQLQQFVNGKTQKPIEFSYKTLFIDGVKIGVIKIPLQDRPFYLLKDYGKVRKNVVYVRRGSGTDEANPDEIHNMGKAEVRESVRVPNLIFEFADLEKRLRVGKEIKIDSTLLDIPPIKSIPDYSDSRDSGQFSFLAGSVNSDYYRKLVIYYYVLKKSRKLSFSITNNSSTSAIDVRVELTFRKVEKKFTLFEEGDFPKYPKSRSSHIINPAMFTNPMANRKVLENLKLQDLGDAYRVEVIFEKVQPMQSVYSASSLYIAVNEGIQIQPQIKIFADNIPSPIESILILNCTSTEASGSLDDIKAIEAANSNR